MNEPKEEMPLADEFSDFAHALDASRKLALDAAIRARFSRLYRRLSEIDEQRATKPRRR